MKSFLLCFGIFFTVSVHATTSTGNSAKLSFAALEHQFEYSYASVTDALSIETTVRHNAEETITCEREIVKYNNVVDSINFKCLED